MPWKIFMEDDQHCVYKIDADEMKTGNSLGCHDTEDEAKDQLAALNANEDKEASKTKMYNGEKMEVPYIPAISFSELEAAKEAQKFGQSIKEMATHFSDMVFSILNRDDIEDKTSALSNLANEFTERVEVLSTKESQQIVIKNNTFDDPSIIERVANSVKKAIGLFPKKEQTPPSDNFLIWKEDDTYHWLAIYSNNIIDKEQEIISSQSHQKFVDLVDKGLAPLPELWLWHRPEWKWGQATQVAYDDSGFAIATGIVDKGCESIAEWCLTKQLPVSHGMLPSSIKYDPINKQVITDHITKEISPLLNGKEANSYTGFAILKEDNSMAIPKEKREALLKEGLSEEALAILEEKNQATQKEVSEAGLETKEAVTTDDLVKAVQTVTEPMIKLLQKQQSDIELLAKEVGELKKADEQKVKDLAESTPPASIEALIKKQIPGLFSEENGTSEAPKSAVKEVEPSSGLFWDAFAQQDGGQ